MSSKSLYVGNLPYSANESSLLSMFSAYGAKNARVVEGRGFGFVDIDAESLEAAISEKNNVVMDGRTLTVNEAKPREDKGRTPSRGGRW